MPSVYPRPRGGTYTPSAAESSSNGLSPPTRGNLRATAGMGGWTRSIPAHAGEPCSSYTWRGRPTVYPRPRGGTRAAVGCGEYRLGLSPPTRGNPGQFPPPSVPRRSIPAHAGEPAMAACKPFLAAVYPRPRGGTYTGPGSPKMRQGLSPPTRGNRVNILQRVKGAGSIPAHAGEPLAARRSRRRSTVYPRPRGGTKSPRPVPASSSGSIPAHAGEPRPANGHPRRPAVYPRPRGGTAW